MKNFYFLIIGLLILGACNPFSLDDFRGNKDRGPRDTARGEERYRPPDLQEITENIEEIASKEIETDKEKCKDYNNSTGSTLNPWARDSQNCIAKALDESFKPLCEQEALLKEALEYYEDEGDDRTVEEIELLLDEIEEQKADIEHDLYEMADDWDEVGEDFVDDLEEEYDDDDSIGEKLLIKGVVLFTKDTTRGYTKVVDSKARLTCRAVIDFDKVKSKRERDRGRDRRR